MQAVERLSIAPMMAWTDRHCRYFHRLMSRHALLYTEMVTAPALVHGAVHLLDHHRDEHPLVLQLGGSDPQELAQACRIAAPFGFHEINLNVGCPSDRVQSGSFGAVLMKTPDLVARCVNAMQGAANCPITVKCRIGVDDQNPQDSLPSFVETMAQAGVGHLIIHARKAWLKGLSPKENRDIPPLDYPLVHQIKADFPDLKISINGGITTLEQAQDHLDRGLDGVMIGRAAYHSPAAIFPRADHVIYGQGADVNPDTRAMETAHAMIPYIEAHLAQGGRLGQITRHMLGLFSGRPGARQWRRVLSEHGNAPEAGLAVYEQALSSLSV